jgi:biotin carboxyl carrier protein
MPDYFVQNGEDGDDDRAYTVETLDDGSYLVVTPSGEELNVEAFEPELGRLHMLCGNDSHDLDVRETDESFEVATGGRRHTFDVLNERQKRMRRAGVGGRGADGPDLVSPMAGTVVGLTADKDNGVEEGQTVIIVEAMKMENDLKAHKTGTLTEVHVEPGDSVEIGDPLVSIGD